MPGKSEFDIETGESFETPQTVRTVYKRISRKERRKGEGEGIRAKTAKGGSRGEGKNW